jgi:hypothetical protein
MLVYATQHPLLARWWTRWAIGVAAILLAGAWIFVLGIPSPLTSNGTLIVHYSTSFGIDALGTWRDIMRLPVVGSVLFVLNMSIAFLLSPQGTSDDVGHVDASFIMVVSTVMIEGVVLLASALLWSVNT